MLRFYLKDCFDACYAEFSVMLGLHEYEISNLNIIPTERNVV